MVKSQHILNVEMPLVKGPTMILADY